MKAKISLKEEKGITLIALVITIVVLLILAGVSIATLTGNNGLLTKANESKTKTEEAQEKEGVGLAVISSQMKDVSSLEITKENLEKDLKTQFGTNEEFTITDNGDGSFTIKFDNTGRMYYVESSGKVIANDNILKITTADEFKAFRDEVNTGNTFEGKYIYLSNDITLDINEEWEPIGKYTSSNPDDEINKPFKGVFCGNYYTISGIFINSSKKTNGLFGFVKGGTVKNVGIINSNISGTSVIGGIVGYAYDNAKIINCYSNATITSSDRYVGGIVGYARNNVSIEKCYNSSSITGQFNSGGIVGEISNSKILNCYNIGSIYSNATNSTFTGGICGVDKDNSIIMNSYSIGTITTINNPYSVGAILGKKLDNDIKENNYFLENTVNGSNGTTLEGSTPKTSDELRKLATILGSAFKEDRNNINQGYPILSWQ